MPTLLQWLLRPYPVSFQVAGIDAIGGNQLVMALLYGFHKPGFVDAKLENGNFRVIHELGGNRPAR